MAMPVTNFRLEPEVLKALDAVAEKDNDSRTGVVRRLILDEHERLGLGRQAVGKFVDRLEERFGPEAVLRFESSAGLFPVLKVDSDVVTDLLTLGVYDVGNVVLIYLGDPASTVRLQVGSVPAAGGALEIQLAALRDAAIGWKANS